MATQSYKCPSCGAGLEFKPELQKFKCDYCYSEYTEKEIDDIYKSKESENKEEESSDKKEKGHEHLASYECNSCGAHVVTDDTTTSTFCYYCHNPVIISDRLVGDFQPNKIIPFTVDKKSAQDKFLTWAKKKKFVPRGFTDDSQLEKITGIYLPYWWADCEVDVDYIGEARTVRVWRAGDREYTETKKYQLTRKGQIDINNVSELAFTKIDEILLNGIGPYNEKEAIRFSMPYLSGFFAEQYDVNKEKIAPKIKEQVNRYTGYLRSETINGFNLVRDIRNDVNIDCKEWHYTLLPAWVLTYLYKGKTYVYAVNGQTGKSFGELPISQKKVFNASIIVFGITFLLALIGGALIW